MGKRQKGQMDWQSIVKELQRQGWTVSITKKSQLKCVSPTGAMVMGPGTPGAHRRSMENFLSDLRRRGFQYPPPR